MTAIAWALAAILADGAANASADVAAAATSTTEERQSVGITVYNDGRGLVRETRLLQLGAGITRLEFADVAAKIEPETVRVSVAGGERLAVLEQNYEYDLLSPRKLLEKHVGQTLTLRRYRPNDSNSYDDVPARLLSTNEGTIWEIDGRIITNLEHSTILYPSLPGVLIPRPTLVWVVDAPSAGARTVEATYLTKGMGWQADYVLSLDAAETTAALMGWVTIANASGAAYENAAVQLVAGDLRRAPYEGRGDGSVTRAMAMASEEVSVAARETLFEYHLYTLPRPTTLKQNQTKQVRLLDAPSFAVEKQFVLRGAARLFREDWSARPGPKQKVAVAVTFRNAAVAGLGMPLPRGVVRVYKRDSQARSQFVGENRMDHTPRDERVSLDVGDAFDIGAERRQTDYKRVGNDIEVAFEIRIRNHKTDPVVVRVIEPVIGHWTMVESSHPAKKTAAFEAEFQLPVDPDAETVLTYRVRYHH